MALRKSAPVRFGIIGTGDVADRWLAPALQKVRGARLWCAISRDSDKALAFATRHGAQAPSPVPTDLQAMLADERLDAVIVATPDKLHFEQTLAAIESGKHVFVEKPMATNRADAEHLVRAAAQRGVTLAVGYHLRHHAGHRKISQLIERGVIGTPRHARLCWTLMADASDWRAHGQTGRWWSLGATGTHGIDLVRWLLKPQCGEIVRTRSLITHDVFKGPHDETALTSLQFASGATAEVVSSVLFRAPRVLEIFGTAGAILCTDTLGARGAGSIVVNGKQLRFPVVDPYRAELTDFVRAIRRQQMPLVCGQDGLRNIELLEAATQEK